jgi:hypothetical protein
VDVPRSEGAGNLRASASRELQNHLWDHRLLWANKRAQKSSTLQLVYRVQNTVI